MIFIFCFICNYHSKKSLQNHINREHGINLNIYYKLTNTKKEDVFSKDLLEKTRLNNLGEKNPFFKKTHTKEHKKYMSNKLRNRILSEETKNKMKQSHWSNREDYSKEKHPRFNTTYPEPWCKGKTKKDNEKLMKISLLMSMKRKGQKLSEQHKINISISGKKNYERLSEEEKKQYIKKMTKGLKNKNTGLEKYCDYLFKKNNIPLIHNSKHDKIINGVFPDFYNEELKIIIEVYCEFFKKKIYGNINNYIEKRKKRLEQWDVLFFEQKFIYNYSELFTNIIFRFVNKKSEKVLMTPLIELRR